MAKNRLIEVNGIEDAVGRIKKVMAVIDDWDRLQQVFVEAAQIVGAEAQGIAPVSDDKYDETPGLLRNSIHVEPRGKKYPSAVVIIRIRDCRYCAFEEFGTKHAPANPYMRPAIDTKGPSVVEYIAYRLRGLIEGANG